MISGFCFAEPGTDIRILTPQTGTDFFVLLKMWCEGNDITHVAITPDILKIIPDEIGDILKARLNIIVVDMAYSPIHDRPVLPLLIHRDIKTFAQSYHDVNVVCIGGLIPLLIRLRNLDKLQVKYINEGEPIVDINISKRSGWSIFNTVGGANIVHSHVFGYRIERDYELENKKK